MVRKNKKVLVALSGGVDSSLSAALLQDQGYDVEGAFIVTWTAPWLPCTWRDERRDAMRVAAHLSIPFHTVDLSKEYERDVVEYLVNEYRAGRTPNPDVMCNKYIKFGGLFDWAIRHEFDFIATGHYARVEKGKRKTEDRSNGRYHLLKGKDMQKDQTYFLWTLTQSHLARTLFPVGKYEKQEVRTLAKKFGLPTASKKDSQGVCFLGKIDMKEFLQHYIPLQMGDVLNEYGHMVGVHDGAAFVTLGQRHGFTVTNKAPDSPPLYIIAKDIDTNTITVAPRSAHSTKKQGITQHIHLTNTNWISGCPTPHLLQPISCLARLRYRQPLFEVVLEDVTDTSVKVIPSTPQPHVPSGQSLVLYDGDICLGGGIIAP